MEQWKEPQSKRTVSRREFLEYFTAVGAMLGLQQILKVPLIAAALETQRKDGEALPADGEVVLYKVNPVRAETLGPEYTVPFQRFTEQLKELAGRRELIYQLLSDLQRNWRSSYHDSDDGWHEPYGMGGYNEVLDESVKLFGNKKVDALAQVPVSFPVAHEESTNDDVHIEEYKPAFNEKYKKNLDIINAAGYFTVSTALVYAVAEAGGFSQVYLRSMATLGSGNHFLMGHW